MCLAMPAEATATHVDLAETGTKSPDTGVPGVQHACHEAKDDSSPLVPRSSPTATWGGLFPADDGALL